MSQDAPVPILLTQNMLMELSGTQIMCMQYMI